MNDTNIFNYVIPDKNNRRIFDEHDVAWIKSLSCLKNCGMSIKDMKKYLNLCLQGTSTIHERKQILNQKRKELLEQIKNLESSIQYIDHKQQFYDDVLSGKKPYVSNLIPSQD